MFKKNPQKIITNSDRETIAVGKEVAAILKPGDIIFLLGELGSGKTVFVKGVCCGLGVKEEVTSSSFVIATEYHGHVPVVHIDLYRLTPSDLINLPLEEYVIQNGITLIEWADRINNHHMKGIRVQMEIQGVNKREIKIEDFRD